MTEYCTVTETERKNFIYPARQLKIDFEILTDIEVKLSKSNKKKTPPPKKKKAKRRVKITLSTSPGDSCL